MPQFEMWLHFAMQNEERIANVHARPIIEAVIDILEAAKIIKRR